MKSRINFSYPSDESGIIEVITSHDWGIAEFVSHTKDYIRKVIYKNPIGMHSIRVHLGGRFSIFSVDTVDGPASNRSPNVGDVWIIPSHVEYAVTMQGENIQFAEIHISPDAMAQLVGTDQSTHHIVLKQGVRDDFIYYAMVRLSQISSQSDQADILFARSLIVALASYIFSNYSQHAIRAEEVAPSRFDGATRDRVEQFVEANLGDGITVDALASVAGIARRPFIRGFRSTFGMTPIQYVISRRLARARELLANDSLDITGIAMTTGFSSHAHLTHTFKTSFGLTPSEYRRKFKS